MNTRVMTSNTTWLRESPEVTTEPAVAEHPDTHLYQVGADFFMIADPIILIVGLAGNSLSFLVMQRSSVRNSPVSAILCALAVFDTLVLVLDFLNNYLKFYLDTFLLGYKGFCEFHRYIFNVVYTVCGWLVVLVTGERFIVVWYPLQAKSWCTKKNTVCAILIIIITICVIYLYNLWGYQVDSEGGCEVHPRMEHFMNYVSPWLTAILYSYIPLTVIIVCNVGIVYKLRKAREARGKVATSAQDDDSSKKITVTVLALCLTFMLLTMPLTFWYIIMFAASDTIEQTPRVALGEIFVLTIGLSNHAVNFFLYVITSDNFRRELRRMLCGKKISKQMKGTRSIRNIASSDSLSTSSTNVTKLTESVTPY